MHRVMRRRLPGTGARRGKGRRVGDVLSTPGRARLARLGARCYNAGTAPPLWRTSVALRPSLPTLLLAAAAVALPAGLVVALPRLPALGRLEPAASPVRVSFPASP